jgi:H+-transporting ATPase
VAATISREAVLGQSIGLSGLLEAGGAFEAALSRGAAVQNILCLLRPEQTEKVYSEIPQPSASPLPEKSAAPAADDPPTGLTSEEARCLLDRFGPMPDTSVRPFRMVLEKFWAPVPWMLEAAIVLELALDKYVKATIIAGLLVFNAALGLFQESRAQATLAALKSRLALNASVRRDGAWKTVPAAELVPGDVVKLSLGGVVAADVHLTGGEVLLDQSTLTGESVPIEATAGVQTYAGALVRRGRRWPG